MDASIPPSIAAQAILIMAGKTFVFVLPVLVVAALWWLADRIDLIIARVFPLLEWERSLGWLNIRAERRARTALRWLGFALHLALAAALLGMVRETRQIVDELAGWPDGSVIGPVMVRIGLLSLDLAVWIVFLGGWLLPKIRSERELAGLRRFRSEMEEQEQERARDPRPPRPPQLVSKYQKSRSDSTFEALLGQPGRLRRQPGE